MRGQDYADLRAFVTVAEELNFGRAAARLRMSPSALSQTIRGLEERLGTRLLNRTTRSTALTEAGARLLARFRPAMQEMEAALLDVSHLRGSPAGTVRLCVPRLAAATVIEPILGPFARRFPDIVVDITIDDAMVNIVEAGYDLDIALGDQIEKDMVAVAVGDAIRQLAVASPDYLARHGCPQTPADLPSHRCINWRKPGGKGLYRWEFQQNGQRITVAVNGPLIVSHRDLALTAAAQGVGIAFTFWSDRWARPLIEQGQLIPILEAYSPSLSGWHLFYPRQRYMAPAVRALVDFLRNTGTLEA